MLLFPSLHQMLIERSTGETLHGFTYPITIIKEVVPLYSS